MRTRRLTQEEKTRRKWERVRARFFAKVIKTKTCWLWTGRCIRSVYGHMRAFDRTRWQAHRLSWFLHFGKIPASKWVLHDCDNPRCVNPKHLFLGNHAANVADKVAKNRQSKGEQCRKALTEPQVNQIISLLARGWSYRRLARMFGVTWPAIYAIKKGITWKHVPR